MIRTLILFFVLIAPAAAMAQRGPGRGSLADVWKALAVKHDTNQDDRISAEEYTRGPERFQALDRNDDGVLTADDFQKAGRRGPPRKPSRTPEQGDVAPDFELPFAKDETKTVRLSSFAGKRPVALVFGSYT